MNRRFYVDKFLHDFNIPPESVRIKKGPYETTSSYIEDGYYGLYLNNGFEGLTSQSVKDEYKIGHVDSVPTRFAGGRVVSNKILVTIKCAEEMLDDTDVFEMLDRAHDLDEATRATNEGIFDRFKKKKPETKSEEEPKQETPKKKEITTYSYQEWIEALEYGHKYYAEDGPEAGKTRLWGKAIQISGCKNLAKDVTDCMDAWMKQEGQKNFPHKSYAKHLEESMSSF